MGRPALPFFVFAVGALHFMKVEANKSLPEDGKISCFLPMTRWNRVTDEHRRFYPQGRAELIWQAFAIGTAVLW